MSIETYEDFLLDTKVRLLEMVEQQIVQDDPKALYEIVAIAMKICRIRIETLSERTFITERTFRLWADRDRADIARRSNRMPFYALLKVYLEEVIAQGKATTDTPRS